MLSDNIMESGHRIGINAHLLSGEAGYRQAGIHHYIAQVLHHLPLDDALSADKALAYTIFTQHTSLLNQKGLTVQNSRWPTEKRLVRIAWEQAVWPWLAYRQQLDLLHGMAFATPLVSPCPTIVTVYDLSFIHYPDRFPWWQRFYLQTQTVRSCKQARRVITISESSRQDVHHHFQVPLDQIDVVYPGVDVHYRPLSADVTAQFRQQKGLPQQFILHVGTLQPRKNIPVLIEALAHLPPELSLILVGGKGWLFEEIFARITALGLQSRVHFTGYVPDEELLLWYNAASLLVFPSVYEGFGMPVVEAMACGTPVIAANTSSIPEAAGTAALLFDPQDVRMLAAHITAVLQDTERAAHMRTEGMAWAKNFSWSCAGRKTADVYRRALQSK